MDSEHFFALPTADAGNSRWKGSPTLPTDDASQSIPIVVSYSTSDLVEDNARSIHPSAHSAPLNPGSDWGAGMCSPRCATPPPPYKDHVNPHSQSAPSTPSADHHSPTAALVSLVKSHYLRQPVRSSGKLHDAEVEVVSGKRGRIKKDDGFYQRILEKIAHKFKDEAPDMNGRDISWPIERHTAQSALLADDSSPNDHAVMTPLPCPTDGMDQRRNGEDVFVFRADFRDEGATDTVAPSASVPLASQPTLSSTSPSQSSELSRPSAGRRRSFRSSPHHSINLDTISEEVPATVLPQRPNSDVIPRRCPDSPTLGYGTLQAQEAAPAPLDARFSQHTRPHISEADRKARSRLKKLRRKAPAALNLENTRKANPRLPQVERASQPVSAELADVKTTMERANGCASEKSCRNAEQFQEREDPGSWFSDASDYDSDECARRSKVSSSTRPIHFTNATRQWLQNATVTFLRGIVAGGMWLSNELQKEMPLKPKHVRIRWTCKCGEELHDDFLEVQAGAARELEATLNARFSYANTGAKTPPTQDIGRRIAGHTSHNNDPDSAPTSASSSVFSLSNSPTAASDTSADVADSPLGSSFGSKAAKTRRSFTAGSSAPYTVSLGPRSDIAWLLTCAAERTRTPKVSHLNMDRTAVRSDKDLALALRAHYASLHSTWCAPLRLRGLTGVDFVQFEMHATRVADVRARPAMPPRPPPNLHLLADAPDHYLFEAAPLLPPVGSNYLMHMLAHPHDFEDESIALARAPKRIGRLAAGTGWGLELVEGFLAARVWGVVVCGFVLASAVFVSVWLAREGRDLQGAFAVASWVLMLAGLVFGWVQACVEQQT